MPMDLNGKRSAAVYRKAKIYKYPVNNVQQFLRKCDRTDGVPPSHGLAQRGELVTRRHRVVTMPQLLWYVRLVLPRPLLNKAVNVRWFLVDAACEALLKTLCVSSDMLLATVAFQLW